MCLFLTPVQTLWREEQAERLAKKDAEEAQALEDLQTQAKTELEEWYNSHEEQLNQTKGLNRWVESCGLS